MVTKDGTWKEKFPTAYRTKNKDISIDGDKKKRCPICGKARSLIVYAKPQNINEHDSYLYNVQRCSNCKYVHIIPLTEYGNKKDDKNTINN